LKKLIFIFLLLLGFTGLTLAKENSKTNTILVTTSRILDSAQNIPANIQVITRDEIRETNTTSIPEILSKLGGLNITGARLGQFNQGASADIGGYGAASSSNTLVLINGQRLSPIDSAAPSWEIIPIDAIDRIEIIKGSASVQYGDRATGGVINIITNESQKSINKATVGYGSFDTRSINAIFQDKSDDILFRIATGINQSNGWRQNTASDQYSLDTRLTKYFGLNSIFIEAFGNHNKNELPGAVITEVGKGDPRSVKCDNYNCFKGAFNKYDNYGLSLGTRYELTDNIKFEGDLSYKNSKSYFYKNGENTALYSAGSYVLSNPPQYQKYESNLNQDRIDFSPRIKVNLKNLGNLIVGADIDRSDSKNDSNTSTSLGTVNLNNKSLYFIHALPLKENLDLIAGFRRQLQDIKAFDYDGYDRTNAEKTTSANAWEMGLNYKFSGNEKIYIKYNQAFRFPNIDEFWGYAADFSRTFFGGIIKPQKDRTAEIGSDFYLGNTKVTTSLFFTKTDDGIRYQVATGKNINDPDEVERKGMYLSTNSKLTEKLSFYTNSKLQEAKYSEGSYKGKDFDLVSNLLINARLNYQFNEEYSLGAITNYVGTKQYDGANDTNAYLKMSSYLVSDIYANKKINQFDLRLTIKNITDEKYSTYGGHQVKNPSLYYSGYFYYPSDGRSIFASMSYNF
jgi:iron complex outermembrane receptor protein